MRKLGIIWIFSILMCICLSSLDALCKPVERASIGDRWALLIGIDKFQDKEIKPLVGASLNAINLNDFLIARGGYEKDHIKLLVNEKATYMNVFRNIGKTWLSRVAKPNDLVVIYVSTACIDRSQGIEKSRFLMTHDTKADNLFATGIKLENFVSTLKLRLNCNNLLVIIDSDYSGAAQIEPESGRSRVSNSSGSSKKTKSILLCSCSKNEKSTVLARGEGTIFTELLIDFIADGDYDCPISKIFDLTKLKLQKQIKKVDGKYIQNPILKSNWKGKMPSIQPPISESN